jgi:hypothetical protein
MFKVLIVCAKVRFLIKRIPRGFASGFQILSPDFRGDIPPQAGQRGIKKRHIRLFI